MKFLIVGLGNIGEKYQNTRHNIGFKILDFLAKESNIFFSTDRYGDIGIYKQKNNQIILLKPSTYMNLSGKAVDYWIKKEKIHLENILIVCDDLAFDFGKNKLKSSGSDGGHNGLKDIALKLNTINYPRLRIGIGNKFSRGRQVDYVLGNWTEEENETMEKVLRNSIEYINTFCSIGIQKTMNLLNNKDL